MGKGLVPVGFADFAVQFSVLPVLSRTQNCSLVAGAPPCPPWPAPCMSPPPVHPCPTDFVRAVLLQDLGFSIFRAGTMLVWLSRPLSARNGLGCQRLLRTTCVRLGLLVGPRM